MKRLLLILLIMIPVIDGCGTAGKTNATATTETTAEGPKGELVYCSFSETRNGGLGKDYCELVADPGTVPEVRVRMNVNNHMEGEEAARKAEYKVTPGVVKDLQRKLAEAKVYSLDGYSLDEQLCGGATYRIYMEYSSGESVNAIWFGHEVKPEAVSAYGLIERFFQPWIKKCCSH